LEVPPGVVVTLTALFPVAAVAAIAQFALTVVAVGGVTVLMVQTTLPAVPDTFTAVAPDRLVPVRVTATGTPAVREPDVGEIEVSVGPTMNVTLLEVTPGVVVTLTFLFPVAAVAVIAQFAVTVVAVGVPLMVQTTLPAIPDTFTAVVPDRLLPVRVIGTLGPPRTPDVGAIEVSVGLTTVNVTLLVVTPGVVVTLTFLFPVAAVAAIAHVALTVVVVGGVTVLMVQTTLPAVPDTFTAVAPDRLVPVRSTGTLVPRTPDVGAIEVSVGPTVNVTVLEVTPGVVVTLTVLFPVAAAVAIAHVALTVVAVGGVAVLMVQTTLPAVPDTFTAVVPDRLLPVRTTGTLVPRAPDVGAIEVSVGPTTVNATVLLVTPSAVTLTFL